jgi:hypothetical protein
MMAICLMDGKKTIIETEISLKLGKHFHRNVILTTSTVPKIDKQSFPSEKINETGYS